MKDKKIIDDGNIIHASNINPYIYDPLTMPPKLLKAHKANDIAVMKAYGLPIKETDEAACVAFLMKRYQELTAEEK